MKALRFDKTGDLKHLHLIECPTPKPGRGEVLVQVRAAGLNQSDVSNVLGKHPYTTLPRTPGRDFAGVVVEGPAGLLGKAVWGTGKELGFTRDGTHAEFLTAPASGVAVKPESLSFSQAASCGVPYTTAWSALERCAVAKETKFLVIGAAGAVGSAAVAMARWRGAEVVGAVRRTEQAEALRAQGIPAIVLPQQGSLGEAIKQHFPEGASVILDATGSWLAPAISGLAYYGRIAVIVAPGDGQVTVPVRDLYRRAGSIVGINSLLYSAPECARILEVIAQAFDGRQLPLPSEPQQRPLESGVEVYGELSKGRRGKLVLVTAS